jgi:hypothetical protein
MSSAWNSTAGAEGLALTPTGPTEVVVADADRSLKEPALARVTIYEVAERPWGWLITNAEVDDRVYVGSREWRQRQLDK